jgi:cytochrome c553
MFPVKFDNNGEMEKMRRSHVITWFASLVLPLVAVAAHALTLSPGSLALMAGGSGTISLSSVRGTASLVGNSAPAVATATLASNRITVKALALGTTKLTVKDGKETKTTTVTVTLPMTVTPGASSTEIHPGRLLASNCFQCHGTNGSSGGFDRLQGDSSADLLEKLRKFASGDGDSIMAAHALGYTDAQLQLIADFLSKQ